jgi:hypothetical protein
MRSASLSAFAMAALFGACSPSHEWRELRPPESGIVALFPCKPDRHARSVTLAGRTTRMEMLVCSAGDTTFALAFADIADPSAVAPVLAELRAAAIANLGGKAVQEQMLQVPGMTPNPRAVRIRFDGRRPDGAAVQEQAAFFVRGLRVYQASVLAPVLAGADAETFIGGLRLAT